MNKQDTQICEECLGDRYIGGLICKRCGGEGVVDVAEFTNLCVAELDEADPK